MQAINMLIGNALPLSLKFGIRNHPAATSDSTVRGVLFAHLVIFSTLRELRRYT